MLTTVSVINPIWVYFTISDNDLLHVRQLKKNSSLFLPEKEKFDVELVLSNGSIYPIKGKVDFSAPTYDRSTGTLLVRAVFDNPTGNLRPGEFARVKVYGAERPNALLVPTRALMQKKGGMFVYRINHDKKVEAQDVSTGDIYNDYQIITNGLKVGDEIIVDGINKVRPGMTVNSVGTINFDTKTPATAPSS